MLLLSFKENALENGTVNKYNTVFWTLQITHLIFGDITKVKGEF